MVKKKKKTKVIKDKFIQDVLNKQIEERNKIDEPSDLIGKLKGALIIFALITFFSGGWFPFGLIDKFHTSKKEINYEWSQAYMPLFKWCDDYTSKNRVGIDYELDREPGITAESYNKILPEVLKCIEDKNLRIYLFNNQPFKIKANKLMKSFFNQLPEEIKNFKMNNSSDLLELNNVQINTNRHKLFYVTYDNFDEYQKMTMWDEDRDVSQYFCINDAIGFFCDKGLEKLSSKNIFRLGFLSEKNFWTISMACKNNCLADIKYIKENKIQYIKEFKLHNYVAHKFDDFSDKNSEKFKEYDEMIKTIENKISKLIDKYEKPSWALRVDL